MFKSDKKYTMSLCIYCDDVLEHKICVRRIDEQLEGWQAECQDCFARTPLSYDELLLKKLLKNKNVYLHPENPLRP